MCIVQKAVIILYTNSTENRNIYFAVETHTHTQTIILFNVSLNKINS